MFIERPIAKFALSALGRAAAKAAEQKGYLGTIGAAVGSLIPKNVEAETQPGSGGFFSRAFKIFDPTFGFLSEPKIAGGNNEAELARQFNARQTSQTTPPPSQPSLPIGGFAGKPPAAAGPMARAPITTPTPAPTPATRPPIPTLPGGGGAPNLGSSGRAPVESVLPPAPALASEISRPVGQPVGQFDAMIRALQAQQVGPSRYVQMPMAGAAPFGPAGAQERALKKLRERELSRILGGIPANV